MKIGSLCTGYGGLDMAVEAYFNAETIWCAEIDKQACKVIDARFNLPNHGDIKTIDWASLEPIDILTAGYPCQPFSHAGQRKGTNDERHIWPHIKEAIGILRPRIVVLENVRGHLSLGFKEVLKDLAEIGYDAKWQIVRASDVGAPHRRERLFIIAYASGWWSGIQPIRDEEAFSQSRNNDSASTDSNGHSCKKSRRASTGIHGSSSSEFNWSDWHEYGSGIETHINSGGQFESHDGQMQKLGRRFTSRCDMHLQDVPNPLDQNDKLNAKFVEYMMGLPAGWVTDLDLSRAQQLKILGNGVVPQQAYYALACLS
jgi:DNA (cytosine-5)-methyltransferase 1